MESNVFGAIDKQILAISQVLLTDYEISKYTTFDTLNMSSKISNFNKQLIQNHLRPTNLLMSNICTLNTLTSDYPQYKDTLVKYALMYINNINKNISVFKDIHKHKNSEVVVNFCCDTDVASYFSSRFIQEHKCGVFITCTLHHYRLIHSRDLYISSEAFLCCKNDTYIWIHEIHSTNSNNSNNINNNLENPTTGRGLIEIEHQRNAYKNFISQEFININKTVEAIVTDKFKNLTLQFENLTGMVNDNIISNTLHTLEITNPRDGMFTDACYIEQIDKTHKINMTKEIVDFLNIEVVNEKLSYHIHSTCSAFKSIYDTIEKMSSDCEKQNVKYGILITCTEHHKALHKIKAYYTDFEMYYFENNRVVWVHRLCES
jgi:hypothetical protein